MPPIPASRSAGERCAAQMRVIALIEDPAVIERILSWLGLWHPLPACGPSSPAEHASLPHAASLVGIFVGPVVLAVTYTLLENWVLDRERRANG
jgi:hypothetical protein